MQHCTILISSLIIIAACTSKPQTDPIATFVVGSGEYNRINTPVFVEISELTLVAFHDNYQLVEVTDGIAKEIASQLEKGEKGDLLWWVLDGETHAGHSRRFELRKTNASQSFHAVNITDVNEAVQFDIAGKKVLAYHYGLTPVPEGVSEIYRRGGYIHPLWSPKGAVLTRIQPPDHYHHYGIWNPWTSTEFEGQEIDFWNLNKKQGTVIVSESPTATGGPVFADLRAYHKHIVLPDSVHNETRPALNEEWKVRIWNADPLQKVWLVDFVSVLSCATESPLTIKEYRYQGFSIRANEHWNDGNTILLTSAGKNKSDANATRARWININGASEVGNSGLAILTHPDNFNFPEQLRIWPTGMNDGEENVFVNFNPAQDRDWQLVPGETYTLKYRIMIYDGSIDSMKAENYWNDYAHPPQVLQQ